MATSPNGVSHAEVIQLVAKSKDGAPPPERQRTITLPLNDIKRVACILAANYDDEILRLLIGELEAEINRARAACPPQTRALDLIPIDTVRAAVALSTSGN